MRKLTTRSKLSLGLETIRELSNVQLSRVAGAGIKTQYQQVCSYDENTRYSMYAFCTVTVDCID